MTSGRGVGVSTGRGVWVGGMGVGEFTGWAGVGLGRVGIELGIELGMELGMELGIELGIELGVETGGLAVDVGTGNDDSVQPVRIMPARTREI